LNFDAVNLVFATLLLAKLGERNGLGHQEEHDPIGRMQHRDWLVAASKLSKLTT
jgi:hypothetical protein